MSDDLDKIQADLMDIRKRIDCMLTLPQLLALLAVAAFITAVFVASLYAAVSYLAR